MSANINSVEKPQAAGPFYIHAQECGGRVLNRLIPEIRNEPHDRERPRAQDEA